VLSRYHRRMIHSRCCCDIALPRHIITAVVLIRLSAIPIWPSLPPRRAPELLAEVYDASAPRKPPRETVSVVYSDAIIAHTYDIQRTLVNA